MGGGAAMGDVSAPGHPLEVPRLTGMLRSALSSSGGGSSSRSRAGSGGSAAQQQQSPLPLPDLQRLLQQRSQLLEGRRRERADMQVSSAREELVGAVLGGWAGAPKAARDDFEKYMRAVAQLLGGESSSEEVAAAAAVAWQALCAHPPDTSRGRSLLAGLQKARSQLESQLGRVEDAALLQLAQQQAALLRWQQQLNPKAQQQQQQQAQQAQQDTGKGQVASASGGGKGGAPPVAPAVVPPPGAMSAEDAVLAVCGIAADVAAAAYAAAAGVTDGGAAAAAAAAFAAALVPKAPPRVVTAAEQAAVEADVFGAKGRVLNAQAGARWLVSWCSKVTGGSLWGR